MSEKIPMITGLQFYNLKVIEKTEAEDWDKSPLWRCKCNLCNAEVWASYAILKIVQSDQANICLTCNKIEKSNNKSEV